MRRVQLPLRPFFYNKKEKQAMRTAALVLKYFGVCLELSSAASHPDNFSRVANKSLRCSNPTNASALPH
jgi:hypothetical protein